MCARRRRVADLADVAFVVVHTIRGFRGRDRSIGCLVEMAWTEGFGRDICLPHRPGTAKVRPKQALKDWELIFRGEGWHDDSGLLRRANGGVIVESSQDGRPGKIPHDGPEHSVADQKGERDWSGCGGR